METVAVTGDVTDSAAKLVPLAPVVIPAIAVTLDALILPEAAEVVSGCTCKPVMVNWSAPVTADTVIFTVRAVAVMVPEMPVMFEPVM